MDTKIQGLDPKLREAYERVMGTNLSPAAQSPMAGTQPQAAQPNSPQPEPSTPVAPPTQPEPVLKETAPQEAQPSQPTVHETSETAKTFVAYQNPKNKSSEGKKISTPILILGIIAFFTAYIFVWIKIFGLQLPFLP